MAHQGGNPPSPVDNAAEEALVPTTPRVVYTPNTRNNYYMNFSTFTTAHQVVVDVLRGHPLYSALTMTVEVPDIYLQQFWYTVDVETQDEEKIVAMVDQTEVTVTLDELRQLLHLPDAMDLVRGKLQPVWYTLFTILNRCLSSKTKGIRFPIGIGFPREII